MTTSVAVEREVVSRVSIAKAGYVTDVTASNTLAVTV
jgi:hypothetical protein